MKSFDINEMKREHLLIAAAVVLFVALAQFVLIKKLQDTYMQLAASIEEMQVQKSAVESRSDAVIQFKSTVKIDDKKLPVMIETQNRFYAVLLNLLSVQGFGDADVTKAEETGDIISFKVSGEANYNKLLYLLSSFRRGNYMIRVNEMTLDGLPDNNVKYSFTVSAKVSAPVAAEEAGK